MTFASAYGGRVVVPSDTALLRFDSLYVGGIGDVAIGHEADPDTPVIYSAIPAGTHLQVRGLRVFATDTTATLMTAASASVPTTTQHVPPAQPGLLSDEKDGMSINFISGIYEQKTEYVYSASDDALDDSPLAYTGVAKWIKKGGVWSLTNGTDIPLDGKGFLCEPAAENVFINSQAPVTQDITMLAAEYTVSVVGGWIVTPTGETAATEGNPSTFTALAADLSFVITGSAGSGFSNVQVELGPVATSPVVVAAAAVTRAADNLSMLTAGLPWWPIATGGTVFAQATSRALDTVPVQTVLSSGATSRLMFSPTAADAVAATDGTTAADYDATAPDAFKAAMGFVGGVTLSAALGGVLGETDLALPGSLYGAGTTLHIGISEGADEQFNGHIKTVMVLPRRMANSEMTSLTA